VRLGPARKRDCGNGNDENDSAVHRLVFGRAGPAGFALGQHPAPTDYKGVKESALAAIDLAKEIDSVENRELRVSRAIVAPGGHIGLQSHRADPTIVYVLEGAPSTWRALPRLREQIGMSSRVG
jgi:hypothetical protein